MRIFVIGGAGFIGRFVVTELVATGHEVTILHRGTTKPPSGVKSLRADRSTLLERRDQLAVLRLDVVIDMILSSSAQARATLQTFQGIARRVVAISSGDVYRAMAVLQRLDEGPLQPVPLKEDSEMRAISQTYTPEALAMIRTVFPWVDSEYDKVQVERAIVSNPELPATIVRLPMVYGPGDPLHRFFPALKRMLDHRPAILLERSFANWRPCRGYVENTAHAIALAATSEQATGQTYHVSDQDSSTEAEWTEKIGSVLGWTGRVLTLTAEQTPPHLKTHHRFEQDLLTDSTKIRRELGFSEIMPLQTAIARTIECERANPPAQINPAQFDYPAEDDAIVEVTARRTY